ncbi:hypothetical protein GTW71_18585 [Streptomyces sp. SID6041]|nr:hypothetical protein [Streptomyces sp. SID6041]
MSQRTWSVSENALPFADAKQEAELAGRELIAVPYLPTADGGRIENFEREIPGVDFDELRHFFEKSESGGGSYWFGHVGETEDLLRMGLKPDRRLVLEVVSTHFFLVARSRRSEYRYLSSVRQPPA